MSMPSKSEGAQANCWKCQANLICRTALYMVSGRQQANLQWQNASDGKPHYKCTGVVEGTKVFECVAPTLPAALAPDPAPVAPATQAPSITAQAAAAPVQHKTSRLTPHRDQVEYLRYALDLEQVVVDELMARGDTNPNPARVGMLMKLVLDAENSIRDK